MAVLTRGVTVSASTANKVDGLPGSVMYAASRLKPLVLRLANRSKPAPEVRSLANASRSAARAASDGRHPSRDAQQAEKPPPETDVSLAQNPIADFGLWPHLAPSRHVQRSNTRRLAEELRPLLTKGDIGAGRARRRLFR